MRAPRPSLVAAVLLTLSASACSSDESGGPPVLRDPEPDAAVPGQPDRDGDGLCDVTELDLGSDPDDADTDGDGLPDYVELIYGFEPADPTDPAANQVGYLTASRGATLDFPVRQTVDAEGADVTGYFEPLSAAYDDGSSARDFFVAAEAVEAQPPDAVRAVDAEAQRFVQLAGSARLELVVRFESILDADTVGCARVYPFRYAFKDDTGQRVAQQLYLLVVAADGEDGPADFCGAASCS